MQLNPVKSQIDGDKHRQNLLLLQCARAAGSGPAFLALLPAIFGQKDSCTMVGPSANVTKTFIVKDLENRRMLIVCCGVNGSQQVDAMLAAWRTAQPPDELAPAPYSTGAGVLLPYTLYGVGEYWNEITLIGHSYGGALALALAAEFYRQYETPYIFTFTYGAPKYGHKSLSNPWRGRYVVNVRTQSDPIPILPPTLSEDPLFRVYVQAGVFGWGPRYAYNVESYQATMSLYSIVDGALLPTTSVGYIVQDHPLPIVAWLLGVDFFAANGHSLDFYTAQMASVPAVLQASVEPQAVPASSVNAPRQTAAQRDSEIRRSLQQAGLQTVANTDEAVRQTREAIVGTRGIFYRRGRIGKVPTINYQGQVVLVCRGRRDQSKVLKALNLELRKR